MKIARTCLPLLCGALTVLGVAPSRADTPHPNNHLVLSASATLEVPKDLMTATLTASRDGTDPGLVQGELKKALEAALTEARRAAKPGQVDVQTGNFSLMPRYSNKGQPSGWQGTAELVIEGRDMAGIGQLIGRVTTMTVGRVGYGLSREQREKVEGEVAAQAIARFRAKALEHAKHFGFAAYDLREVNVSAADAPPVRYAPMMRSAMAATSGDDSLPIEAGKTNVSITVSGTVQMTATPITPPITPPITR